LGAAVGFCVVVTFWVGGGDEEVGPAGVGLDFEVGLGVAADVGAAVDPVAEDVGLEQAPAGGQVLWATVFCFAVLIVAAITNTAPMIKTATVRLQPTRSCWPPIIHPPPSGLFECGLRQRNVYVAQY